MLIGSSNLHKYDRHPVPRNKVRVYSIDGLALVLGIGGKRLGCMLDRLGCVGRSPLQNEEY